jgi:RNA 3'-phosphate cyclase
VRVTSPVDIDGAHGEGGGQLVRTAVALAAVTGTAVRVHDIRARRRRPGLAAQHAAAVRAVAALCDARCDGVQPGSSVLTFRPGALHGGSFVVDVGTAGSVALVLQAMLPAALASGEAVEVVLRGGTDVPMAPPVDYLRLVLLPLLARMGVHAELQVERRGYVPRGGGEVRLSLPATGPLAPFVADERGPVTAVEAHAHVSRLPLDIARRMAAAARSAIGRAWPFESHVDAGDPLLAFGPGGAIVLSAAAGPTVLGAAQVAQRGVPAEQLGRQAALSLRRDLEAGATLDVHAADQMLVFLALAGAPSVFRASALSAHAHTAMWLIETLTTARFALTPQGQSVRVDVQPHVRR